MRRFSSFRVVGADAVLSSVRGQHSGDPEEARRAGDEGGPDACHSWKQEHRQGRCLSLRERAVNGSVPDVLGRDVLVMSPRSHHLSPSASGSTLYHFTQYLRLTNIMCWCHDNSWTCSVCNANSESRRASSSEYLHNLLSAPSDHLSGPRARSDETVSGVRVGSHATSTFEAIAAGSRSFRPPPNGMSHLSEV